MLNPSESDWPDSSEAQNILHSSQFGLKKLHCQPCKAAVNCSDSNHEILHINIFRKLFHTMYPVTSVYPDQVFLIKTLDAAFVHVHMPHYKGFASLNGT